MFTVGWCIGVACGIVGVLLATTGNLLGFAMICASLLWKLYVIDEQRR